MECSTGPRLRNPEHESRQSENTRGENPSAPLKAYVEIVEHGWPQHPPALAPRPRCDTSFADGPMIFASAGPQCHNSECRLRQLYRKKHGASDGDITFGRIKAMIKIRLLRCSMFLQSVHHSLPVKVAIAPEARNEASCQKTKPQRASIRYCTKGWSRCLTVCAKTIEDWRPSPDGVNEGIRKRLLGSN
jgi:hypothetical protein